MDNTMILALADAAGFISSEHFKKVYTESTEGEIIPSATLIRLLELVAQHEREDKQEDEKDAQRYRWLRDKSEPEICAFYLSVGKAFHGVKFARETVDAAIDEQIEKARHTYGINHD